MRMTESRDIVQNSGRDQCAYATIHKPHLTAVVTFVSWKARKMAKTFEITEKRAVVVETDEIRLFEDGSYKKATFSYPRWARFVELFDEIDNAVEKLMLQQEVSIRLHIGGA